jgi:hypothetical protein
MSNNSTTITIEDVEALASKLENDAHAEREKLTRLIRAYARIVSVREPERFAAMPTEYADEDGHWDNSFPPRQRYRARTGPRLVQISDCTTRDVATSSGFYYDWKRVTEHPGVFVSRDGRIYGCEETGTGRVGQFAAHPGDRDVCVEIEWSPRSDLELSELRTAEETLRKLAFPLSHVAA